MREQNQSLKCCQIFELLIYFRKGFRFFYTGKIGYVGQRAAKLLAVKVGGLKKKSSSSGEVCASGFGLGLSPLSFDSFSKFEGL